MEQVQFIQTTPEELRQAILEGVDKRIAELKEHFQPKEPTELLTRKEVKELLNINLSTLHHWTKKGILQAYGIGNRVYYKRFEVEQALIAINAKANR